MNNKVKTVNLWSRRALALFAAAVGLHGTGAAQTCVVGGTDFTTSTALCNPKLTNDADGWFSEDAGDLISAACKTGFSEVVTNIEHKGFQSNVAASNADASLMMCANRQAQTRLAAEWVPWWAMPVCSRPTLWIPRAATCL